MRNKLLTLSIAIVFLAFVSCVKDGDETIVLLGTESYYQEDIYNRIINSLGDYSDVLNGFDLTDGCVPPNIEGDYLISPNYQDYNNSPFTDTDTDSCYIHFGEQHNCVSNMAVRTVNMIHNTEVELDKYYLDTIYIRGTVQKFLAFGIIKSSQIAYDGGIPNIINYTNGIIITGEIETDNNGINIGIRNYKKIETVLNVDTENPDILEYMELPKDGDIMRYVDQDGFSERHQWYEEGMFN